MAKKKAKSGAYQDPHFDLFAKVDDAKRKRLFLPDLLKQAAKDKRLETGAREKAYQVVRNWWAQAKSGRLNRKETTIDAGFLSDLFGALGYRGVTESQERYEREHQYPVPGVGTCDGALGLFPDNRPDKVRVAIELKGALVHLDRDRSNGRTAVQQLWDYLNAMPQSCQWGIVSNFTTIRLYHRSRGSQAFEQFRLADLAANRQLFDQFYAIFEAHGLVKPTLDAPPRAERLLGETLKTQRRVGDELYEYYSENRLHLIQHLHYDKDLELETSIRIAQKLIDRVLFIAFCEDRDLITSNAIERACKETPAFSTTPNPAWENFLGLFTAMDKGSEAIGVENGYNGGLFRDDPEFPIANLALADVPWTQFFWGIGGFDYRHTVDVDVLGHLFEKSVTELERLREGALFGGTEQTAQAMMPGSPQRKLLGIYYTPLEFTAAIVEYTIEELLDERFEQIRQAQGISKDDLDAGRDEQICITYWRACLGGLRQLKVCDPACGSGAFLIRAYDALFDRYAHVITELEHLGVTGINDLFDAVPEDILNRNLYGVDLQPEAVEIAQLSLWLRTARPGKTLADLSENIVCGNSLTDDPEVHPRAMDWREAFPSVFADDQNGGFDCVIGNPPWERLKLQEREFFALSAPEIASAVNAADRRQKIARLDKENPKLYATYQQARAETDRMLTYARSSGRFPLTGKGDINTYVLFAELACQIVAPTGRVGLLVPSGIATDKTTSKFFESLISAKRLIRLYDFENRKHLFPDVHASFKFSIFNVRGSEGGAEATDFLFFAHHIDELKDPKRHVPLSNADLARMNPNTKTCPIFRHRRDAEITKGIYERVRVLVDRTRKENGNPWDLKFVRMFDQTNDAEAFVTAEDMKSKRYRLEGNRWVRGSKVYLPLYEAKMVQAYDHRAASVTVAEGNWVRQGQTVAPTLVERQNPEHVAMPRWWVEEEKVTEKLGATPPALLAFKDVTSATNQRTMIASFIPLAGVVNSAPLLFCEEVDLTRQACLLANLNSMPYDFVARQKVGGVHLNFFIVEQLPTFAPERYEDACPWSPGETLEEWISKRVLKLSCTANDMKPLAEACGFTPPVHRWKPAERKEMLAELDAAFFLLYGVDRADLIYVLSTFQAIRAEDAPSLFEPNASAMLAAAGQRIVKAYDRLVAATESGA